MGVRNTYSSRAVLADILTALSPLSTLAKETTASEASEKMDEITTELKKTRTGHELHLWEEEVDEIRE